MSSASNTDSRKTLLLHFRLDKAGSTSLQSHVFPNIKGFEYPLTKKQDRLLGKLFRDSASNQELIDGISADPIESSRLTRKPVGISTSDDELVKFIRDRIEWTKTRKIILSNEGLWRFVPSRIEQIFCAVSLIWFPLSKLSPLFAVRENFYPLVRTGSSFHT